MGTQTKHLVIIAGEASGDMRAAGLAAALKKLDPSIRLTGIGGTFMRQAGVECFEDITALAVIGIIEVIKHFGRIKKVFEDTLACIDANRPDAVILVDYPGFNLRLAAELKKRGIKVIYYISPQVWAWREKRILRIKNLVDRMIVLFPFEKDIYAKYGMTVDYVGHPLVDEVTVTQPPTSLRALLKIDPTHQVIGLLPGSRDKEIDRHLPVMLETAKILYEQNPKRTFVLLKAATITREQLEMSLRSASGGEAISKLPLPIVIYEGSPYDGIGMMDAAIVASGTATLETALLLKPMIVMYKTSWITYALAKLVIKIPYIGLVNVVAGKKVIEEFIQEDANAPAMANAINTILTQPNRYAAITNDLATIRQSLGLPGASKRAASVILQTINS